MTYKEKIAVCMECDKLDHQFMLCTECGCFVRVKSAIMGSKSCPIGKHK